MIRLNAMLFAVLVACALALVTSQHQARRLFVQLQDEQQRGRDLEIEFGQLQLEQSTWAMQSRIEQVASKKLGMRVPSVSGAVGNCGVHDVGGAGSLFAGPEQGFFAGPWRVALRKNHRRGRQSRHDHRP